MYKDFYHDLHLLYLDHALTLFITLLQLNLNYVIVIWHSNPITQNHNISIVQKTIF